MTTIDCFVNLYSPAMARRFHGDPRLAGLSDFFRGGPSESNGYTLDDILEMMSSAGIDRAIATAGLLGDGLFSDGPADVPYESTAEHLLKTCAQYPDRLRAALTVDRIPSIREVCARIEALAEDPMLVAVRVVPLFQCERINSRIYYPIYERCEAFGLPVTINVGIPGPRVRAEYQQAIFLDDVMIDFPNLRVVAAHMGHPWEDVLVRLMMKYENLYLSNSAYSPKYIAPSVLNFMDSDRGRRKLIFGTDFPLLSFERAMEQASALPLTEDAFRAFMGENAMRVFQWPDDETEQRKKHPEPTAKCRGGRTW